MNAEQVKQIIGNETAKQIVNVLASRERISQDTDIKRFQTVMRRNGFKIIPEEFEGFFKSLEEIGVGSVVYGKRKTPKKFQWYYSLRDVGKAIKNPDEKVELHKLPIAERTPQVRKKKPNLDRAVSEIKETPSASNIMFMFTNSKGDLIPFNLIEADKLVEQVKKVKATLNM
jgi:hypothetical protein